MLEQRVAGATTTAPPRTAWSVDPRVAAYGERFAAALRRSWADPMVRRGTLGTSLVAAGSISPAFLPADTFELPASPLIERFGLEWLGTGAGRVLTTILLAVGMALLVDAWLRMRPVHGRKAPSLAWLLWSLPIMLAPPLFSRDAYSYAAQGQIVLRGMDPYAVGPFWVAGPFADQVDPMWVQTAGAVRPAGPPGPAPRRQRLPRERLRVGRRHARAGAARGRAARLRPPPPRRALRRQRSARALARRAQPARHDALHRRCPRRRRHGRPRHPRAAARQPGPARRRVDDDRGRGRLQADGRPRPHRRRRHGAAGPERPRARRPRPPPGHGPARPRLRRDHRGDLHRHHRRVRPRLGLDPQPLRPRLAALAALAPDLRRQRRRVAHARRRHARRA